MLKPVKLTARQIVLAYAVQHRLHVHGSEKDRWIRIVDKCGHWTESWHLRPCETWEDAKNILIQIEQNHCCGTPRPWESARMTYTGKMKMILPEPDQIARKDEAGKID